MTGRYLQDQNKSSFQLPAKMDELYVYSTTANQRFFQARRNSIVQLGQQLLLKLKAKGTKER